jgi:hypothetical protein
MHRPVDRTGDTGEPRDDALDREVAGVVVPIRTTKAHGGGNQGKLKLTWMRGWE